MISLVMILITGNIEKEKNVSTTVLFPDKEIVSLFQLSLQEITLENKDNYK